MKNKPLLALILIALGFTCRLFNYPPNFSPLGAIALFAGFCFFRRWSLFVPLVILAASDIFIGFYDWRLMASVYASFILIGLVGSALKKHSRWWSVGLGAIIGSLSFFVITNLAFWYFGGFYPLTLVGLSSCFTLAIPFFKNTLIGDLFFTAVFFGIYSLVPYIYGAKEKQIMDLTE
ncbi:MAG TPA: hypothetical protein P5267_02065 [Patescibacteria group bacterium]|nr:hypothetical protein [Patescibacteria group bacterium]